MDSLGWQGPAFAISSERKDGLDDLVNAISVHLAETAADEPDAEPEADDDEDWVT